jgi:hypothetical protein
MKAINRETRKGPGWAERIEPPLTDDERKDLASAAQFNGVIGYPAYALSNLSGNIARQRKRLEGLRAVAAQRERVRVALAAETTGTEGESQ